MDSEKEKDEISNERLYQVYEMSIDVPAGDIGAEVFYGSTVEITGIVPEIGDNVKSVRGLHINDILNILLGCFDNCHENEISTNVLTVVLSVLNAFKNVTVVNFNFIDDDVLVEKYGNIIDMEFKGDKGSIFNSIYRVDCMEIHLCDYLCDDVIRFLNKTFIFHGYIPNDYMNRRFVVEFGFDDYSRFMDMILSNNKDILERFGEEILNFLILFPVIVVDSKPVIRIVTNYHGL